MNAGKRVRAYQGFTLIELLVTIAVIVIMATIAVPNFQSLIASNRQAAEYNKVLSGFHYARSEAVKRREIISFNIDSSTGKWVAKIKDTDGNIIRVVDSKDGMVNVDNAEVVFNPLGRLQACNDGVDPESVVSPCIISVGSIGVEVNAAGNIDKAN